jgi:putative transferase (TIGR04331 family)
LKKKYKLITYFKKFNYKKNRNIIFFNEFLETLYSNSFLKEINSVSAISLKNQNKKKIGFFFLNKKLIIYRKFLSLKLNKFHKIKRDQKYWGLIVDFYLMFLILVVKINFDYYKIIKKKYKSFSYKKEIFREYYFNNSGKLVDYIVGNNLFLGYIRDKIITAQHKENLKNIKKKPLSVRDISKDNFYSIYKKKIFNKILCFYIKFVNPVTLINCYFGKKNSFKLFIKSFGKILCVPSNYFFNYDLSFKKKDYKARKKIMSDFKIKDQFDQIIKQIIIDTMPSSFVEDYKKLLDKNRNFFKIKKIGSAFDLYENDEFKILAAEIVNKGGKLFAYKHGGISEKEIVNPLETINNIYTHKTYEWSNPKGLGENHLSKFKKMNLEKFKKNKQILFFCSNASFNERYAPVIKYSNHPRLNVFYDFFYRIKSKYKENCKIRLFPNKRAKQLESVWKEKYGKKFSISKENKEKSIYNSKIIILDDISTPLYEFLKIGVPFIIIIKDSYQNFKPNFRNELEKLEKIGLIHKSAQSGANFLNNNFENLHDWWKKIVKNKNFNQFKNNLFSSNINFLENIKKELLYDL